MYKILLSLLITLFLFSCTSSKTYMVRGNYDQAINKSVRKIQKKPTREKEIIVLEKSYRRANEVDNERIKFLKQQGSPDIWDEVYAIYSRMKARQAKVKTVLPMTLPSTGRVINFDQVDYDQEILHAKSKAAEFFYARGKNLMEKGGRMNARSAFDDFQRVKALYPNFRDIDDQLNNAHAQGITYVSFRIRNGSDAVLPGAFDNEIRRLAVADMNSQWVQFHGRELENIEYPYSIILNISNIDVSPERVQENAYVETREVQDGFTYVLDNNGNVMKDTAGNDIKIPKMKTLTCQVIETHLSKAAMIAGTLDFFNNETSQMFFSEPIKAESFFNHQFARAQGDIKALKPESLKKLQSEPVPFPPDPDMLLQCADIVKDVSKRIISSNKNRFN